MALDVNRFRPIDDFKATMDDMLSALRSSEKAPGYDQIYTHGEKEFYAEQERRQNGIPYHPTFVKQLRDLATEFNLSFDY